MSRNTSKQVMVSREMLQMVAMILESVADDIFTGSNKLGMSPEEVVRNQVKVLREWSQ